MNLYTILEEALPASHSGQQTPRPKSSPDSLYSCPLLPPSIRVNADTPCTPTFTCATKLMLYTIPNNKDCATAAELLDEHGVCYEEVDVAGDDQAREALSKVAGSTSLPQLFMNGQCIGGLARLLQLTSTGKLNRTLGVHAPDFLKDTCITDESDTSEHIQAGELRTNSGFESAHSLPDEPESLLSHLTGGTCDSLEALVRAMRNPRTGVSGMATSTPTPSSFRRAASLGRSFGRSGSFKFGSSRKEEEESFTGQQAVDWLLRHQRVLAQNLMQQLLDARLITVVADKAPDTRQTLVMDDQEHYYRLTSDIPMQLMQRGNALNAHYWWSTTARPAHKVAEELRTRIVRLYGKYVSFGGRAVSYRGMRNDSQFWEFVDATAELQQVDLRPLSRSELMAMFINLYNVLVIHALVVLGTDAMDGMTKRMIFYNNDVKYNIGGHDYTADDIEHGVLRGNRPGGSALAKLLRFKRPGAAPFGKGDPRLAAVVEPMDPRVHFALVCGAKSCPPISTYSAENLEEGLQAAAQAFCDSEVELRPQEGKVIMSKLFRWYAGDFGSSKSTMLLSVAAYLPAAMRREFAAMIAANKKIEIVYKPYDWSVNSDEK